ncbi:MAG: hypothetical protein IT497_09455 [Ottowia sp.]|nr:hypothetical protein [Ottowia sp.]
MPTPHKWQFASRFRRNAFGWRSDMPIQRIKEALAEIKQIARKDAITAANGAVILLEKLSPALQQVDSSSGALGTAVNNAIDTLVPIIVKADVDQRARQRWLERLWQALEDDAMPYIEILGEYCGELCVTQELANVWVDEFLPVVEQVWHNQASGHSFFKGTSACLASLYAAGRHEQLLDLLARAPYKWWHDRRWGVRALVAMGKKNEALRYAEESKGSNTPSELVAQVCEEILLSSGLHEEAYRRYALQANQGMSNLTTFRAITKKYPHKSQTEILNDLVASTPGAEGKWFAAAKDAGLFDFAIQLVTSSPTDPRTLTRAARDYGVDRPDFATAAGLAALRWMSLGHGYELTALDVLDAHTATLQAATNSAIGERTVREQIRELADGCGPQGHFLRTVLVNRL